MGKEDADVVLINPPYASYSYPSIQLSILKPIAEEEGLRCWNFYSNLLMAPYLGEVEYERLLGQRVLSFLAERLFSEYAFGENADIKSFDEMIDFLNESGYGNLYKGKEMLKSFFGDSYRDHLHDLRDRTIRIYMERVEDVLRSTKAKIYAFTTTFNQNVPSIAIANLVKKVHSDSIVIFGGGNCEEVMGKGLMGVTNSIDYIVSGEGENTFKFLIRKLLKGEKTQVALEEIPGILYKESGKIRETASNSPIKNLDSFPFMDMDDYFEQRNKMQEEYDLSIPLAPIRIEGSRGCWWGNNHHCTFCGLNGKYIEFRSKSPERIIRELNYQSSRHRELRFFFTDNVLNPVLFKNFFRNITQSGRDFSFFLEMRPNITKEQIRILKASGVRNAQPGIESLSTHVLYLMNKGSTKLLNLQVLRWLNEVGIDPVWYILFGFPGETVGDYKEQIELIPLISHLRPPAALPQKIEMHRFSPNFDFSKEKGFVNVRPSLQYYYVYPSDKDNDIRKLAYLFDYSTKKESVPEDYVSGLMETVLKWRIQHGNERAPPRLFYEFSKDFVTIVDSRDNNYKRYSFGQIERNILAISDRVSTYQELVNDLRREVLTLSLDDIDLALENLLRNGLLLQEDRSYLSLPIRPMASVDYK